jgi:hypothetical protein
MFWRTVLKLGRPEIGLVWERNNIVDQLAIKVSRTIMDLREIIDNHVVQTSIN